MRRWCVLLSLAAVASGSGEEERRWSEMVRAKEEAWEAEDAPPGLFEKTYLPPRFDLPDVSTAVRNSWVTAESDGQLLFEPQVLSSPVRLKVNEGSTTAPSQATSSPSPTSHPTTPAPTPKAPRPHIIVFLADDMGIHDSGFAESPRATSVEATPYMTDLANNHGIVLDRHYAHWHCSPSRRSFLTGRIVPRAGGGNLTDFIDDDLDVRMTWISEKLASSGYKGLFYGKAHTGFRSMNTMPSHRGFSDFLGFLLGTQRYVSSERFLMDSPHPVTTFSTSLYGDRAVEKITDILKTPEDRVFLYMSWQTPHSPLMTPPARYRKLNRNWNVFDHNMFAMDTEIGRIVDLFRKDPAVWANTLVLFTSDNGGSSRENLGNNWPFRGEKGTVFEGGIRVSTFLSGGIVPQELRGTHSSLVAHISDWYATFCNLAGVQAADPPPSPPEFPNVKVSQVEDPHFPFVVSADGVTHKNVWGDNSYPDIDSVDLWPLLTNPGKYSSKDAAHKALVVSKETIIAGDWKLILSQPCSNGIAGNKDCKDGTEYGWVSAESASVWEAVSANDPSKDCLRMFDDRLGIGSGFRYMPCLYNLATDRQERSPVQDPARIIQLWKLLNETLLYQYSHHIVGKEDGVTPQTCLGTCASPEEATRFFGVPLDTPVPQCSLALQFKYDQRMCFFNT